MRTGTQWTGSLRPNQTRRWFTFNWPANWHVAWYAMPTNPRRGGPQIEWEVEVTRTNALRCTYWITVKNLTNQNVNFEGRYTIMN